jgi:hypothetical protein
VVEKTYGDKDYISFDAREGSLDQFLDAIGIYDKHSILDKELSMTLFKNGTVVCHEFDLLRSRFSLSVDYVSVDEQGMCENGVRYKDVKEAHDELKAPSVPRFKGNDVGESYPYAVQLRGLCPLSESLLCRMPINHPLVILDKDKWLSHDTPDTLKLALLAWRTDVSRQVKVAWEQVQELEQAFFEGGKSYFRFKRAVNAIPLPEDPFVISSDEELDDGANQSVPMSPTPAPKKRTPLPSSKTEGLSVMKNKGKGKAVENPVDREDRDSDDALSEMGSVELERLRMEVDDD